MGMQKQIEQALRGVIDPQTRQDIISSGMVKNIRALENNVQLTVTLKDPHSKAQLETEIQNALKKIIGSGSAKIFFDIPTHHHHENERLPHVKHVIAVASAKGGVGKSTVAVNLAIALSQLGAKVGLLDADIYGPSIPTLLGLKNVPPGIDEAKNKMLPLEKFNIKSISVGYLMGAQDAAVLRGPMIARMLQQFIDDVIWGELDYLIIDLPPGTGDAQLSLTQLLPIAGVVVVSTPQDIALADVVRGIQMFKKVQAPILGLIENMSEFECPHCHHVTEIFSTGGAMLQSKKMGIPFLGAIPIDLNTRIGSDEGIPTTQGNPDGRIAKIFKDIAQQIQQALATQDNQEISIQI